MSDEKRQEKKFMDDKKLADVTIDDLLTQMLNNTDSLESLEDVSAIQDYIDRTMLLGDVDETSAESIAHVIRFWNNADKNIPIKDRKPIKILIDSPGGSLVGGLMIADAIRMSKTPVYTINIGAAYSAALLVFIAGHRRFCYPSASFLFHEGSTGVLFMDAGKFRNYAAFYDQLILRMKNYFLTYTDMTEEFYNEKYKDDYWFFAEEAIDKGFCDEILEDFV